MTEKKIKERLLFGKHRLPLYLFDELFKIQNNKIYYIKQKESLEELVILVKNSKKFSIRLFFSWLYKDGVLYYWISCMLKQDDESFNVYTNNLSKKLFVTSYDKITLSSLYSIIMYSFPWDEYDYILKNNKNYSWINVDSKWRKFLKDNNFS